MKIALRRVGRGATDQDAPGTTTGSSFRETAFRHDVEARGRQGVRIGGETFRRGCEKPVVPLLVVGPPHGAGAGQQPQAKECAERAQHEHDDPAWSHERRPFTWSGSPGAPQRGRRLCDSVSRLAVGSGPSLRLKRIVRQGSLRRFQGMGFSRRLAVDEHPDAGVSAAAVTRGPLPGRSSLYFGVARCGLPRRSPPGLGLEVAHRDRLLRARRATSFRLGDRLVFPKAES